MFGRKKWEYEVRAQNYHAYGAPEWLREQGEEGWELVTVTEGNLGADRPVFLYIFKRPK